MWVLIRLEDGKYVAKSGSEHSYTNKLENAQVFTSKDKAEANKCGNEYARSVSEIMGF